jgi:isocitrate lyase
MNALISEEFSRAFADKHIYGYIQNIQRNEKKLGVDQLKHQK